MGLVLTPTIFPAPSQTYTGSVTWTGSASPSGATETFQVVEVGGNLQCLRVNLAYSSPGTADTALSMTWDANWPNPNIPSGFSGASGTLYRGVGQILTAVSVVGASMTQVLVRRNAADNGYILVAAFSSIAAAAAVMEIFYFKT